MKRIPGQFVPLDVNYPRDRAIRQAGPDAELVFIRGLVFTKGARTDGYLADFDLEAAMVGLRPTQVRNGVPALVKVGLWTVVEGGWQVRSWDKWNPNQAELAQDTEAKSAGGRFGNHKRWHVDAGKFEPKCSFCMMTDRSTDRCTDSESDRYRIADREREGDREGDSPSSHLGLVEGERSSSSSPTYRESRR